MNQRQNVVERVNRTLKSKLYCYFTAVSSLCYIDALQDLVDSYYNTYHRSIERVPATDKANDLIHNFTPENRPTHPHTQQNEQSEWDTNPVKCLKFLQNPCNEY